MLPHQLHLTPAQIIKLNKGHAVNITHKAMGSGAGDVVIHLGNDNAKRLLSSYKKGKGMRLQMHPHEIQESLVNGRGFFKTLKKYTGINKTDVKKFGANVAREAGSVVGEAIGAYTGNPAMGAMIGNTLGETGARAIEHESIKKGAKHLKESVKKEGIRLVDNQINKLPAEYRDIAEKAMVGEFPSAKSMIERQIVNAPYRGEGFKRALRGRPRMMSNDMVHIDFEGKGVRRSKSSDSEMAEKMARLRAMKGKGVGKKILRGLKSAGRATASTLIHSAIPAVFGVAGDVLGGPLGGVAGSVAGDVLANQIGRATGYGLGLVKRGRGRPRKNGAGASLSVPYKKALKLNKGGLQLTGSTIDNEPISKFDVNPKVRASSAEMTLSPYQRMDSPAMNPFIPSSYTQQGGTSCGYGGKGLY